MTRSLPNKVAILYGGTSSERAVSLESGRAVYNALLGSFETLELIDVGPNFDQEIDQLKAKYEVCFLALHGGDGEDGTLQVKFEKAGICYSGSGPESCKLTMDKVETKKAIIAKGIPTAKMVFMTADPLKNAEAVKAQMTYPVFVKPISGGSSVGLYQIKCDEDFKNINIDASYFAEEKVTGREFTVGVLDGKAMPIIEIKTLSGVYDYDAKYVSDSTQYVFGSVSIEKEKEIQRIASEVFATTDCRDVARIDFLMNDKEEVFVLEVNSLPGMTSHSLLPKGAQKIGLEFKDLCLKILELTFKRYLGER